MDHSPDYYESETILDSDGAGDLDTELVDTDGDGRPDGLAYDGNGDGVLDYAGPCRPAPRPASLHGTTSPRTTKGKREMLILSLRAVLAVLLLITVGACATPASGGEGSPDTVNQAAQLAANEPASRFEAPGDYSLYISIGVNYDSYILFLPQSRLVRSFPAEGPYGINPQRLSPDDFPGSYTVANGAIYITWDSDDAPQVARLSKDGTQFSLYNKTYQLVLSPDSSLSGTYARLGGEPDWPRIHFRPDFMFFDEGIVTALPDSEISTGPGRYTIDDYTLFLFYDNGTARRLSIYAFPEGSTWDADQLELAAYAFVRQ